ncbi:hypothetical protein EVAR_77151_1 [Eumeta japonica]|uniref:Secreted protein n=1 Tax=Eumeta variegata TaxID=151549 RepID=A0A4C1T2P6_EUMVA|nr:hypothetical protein EVAR_77151_1 [Eumeta japonica]
MGGGSLGLGGAVGLAPVLGAVLAVTACVEAETGFRVDSTGGTRSLSLLDRSGEGFASFARDVGADDGSMSISGWSRATFAFFSARLFLPSTRVNEVLLFSYSLSEPTTVLSEHVAPSSDDELAWRLF